MSERTPFPPVFWVANSIEVLERFAYYGIYFGFGIYMDLARLLPGPARDRAEPLPAPLLRRSRSSRARSPTASASRRC